MKKKLLGTGGTIYKNINFLKKSEALILHADNYTKDNLKSFVNFHKIKTKNKIILSILAFLNLKILEMREFLKLIERVF